MNLSPACCAEFKRIVTDSGVVDCDDTTWPVPDDVRGRWELEVKSDNVHVSFNCCKIASLGEVSKERDKEGMIIFYNAVLELRCFCQSLLNSHFKKRPI